jgi:hypothetical protein
LRLTCSPRVASHSFEALAKPECPTHIHVSIIQLQLSTSFQEEHIYTEMEIDSTPSRDPKPTDGQTGVHTVCLAYCLLFAFAVLLLLLPTLFLKQRALTSCLSFF